MPTVTVARADVPRDQVVRAVRQELGSDYTVQPGSQDNVFSVNRGSLSGAKVHIKQHDGATQFHVHGTGLIIGRLINELGIARRVASAITKAPLDQA
jgi:hypothetical protein